MSVNMSHADSARKNCISSNGSNEAHRYLNLTYTLAQPSKTKQPECEISKFSVCRASLTMAKSHKWQIGNLQHHRHCNRQNRRRCCRLHLNDFESFDFEKMQRLKIE